MFWTVQALILIDSLIKRAKWTDKFPDFESWDDEQKYNLYYKVKAAISLKLWHPDILFAYFNFGTPVQDFYYSRQCNLGFVRVDALILGLSKFFASPETYTLLLPKLG